MQVGARGQSLAARIGLDRGGRCSDSRAVLPRHERTACVDDAALAAMLAGEALPREALRHLDDCDDCRTLVGALARDAWGRSVSAPTLGPGAVVGRYVIQRRVGRGAMGAVYAAHDPELGRTVALKVVAPEVARELAAHAPLDARLAEEAKALAQLAHPHVVAVHDAGRFEGGTFLAMEYVDGADLGRWLAGRPSLAQRLGVIVDVARGLAAAHAQGLVHRDVKPANVLVGQDGRARIGDFGLSTRAPAAERAGTPAYMAPELRGQAPATPWSDQWALGLVAAEAVYGRRLGAGEALPSAGLDGEPVPARVRAVLERALATDPSARWPSVQAFAEALAAAAEPRFGRPRTAWAAALGAAVVLVLGGAAVSLRPAPRAASEPRLCVSLGPHARDPIAARYRALDAPWAGVVATAVLERLDAQLAGLRAEVDAHCLRLEAAAGAAERAALQPQSDCLQRRDTALRAAEDVLAEGDATVLARGPELVARAARGCGPAPLPADPARRAEVLAIEDELARLDARDAGGQTASVAAALGALVARARAVADPATEAAVLRLAADVGCSLGAYGRAQADADAALVAADAAGLDVARFQALEARLCVELSEGDVRRARDTLTRLEAVDARLPAEPRRGVALWLARAKVAAQADDRATARGAFEAALGLVREHFPPDDPALHDLSGRYAELLRDDYDLAAAEALLDDSVAGLERSHGRLHPATARLVAILAGLAWARGRLGDAVARGEQALEAYELAYGPSAPVTAEARMGLGVFALEAGRLEAAERDLGRALADFTAVYGPEHPSTAMTRSNWGSLLRVRGRLREAYEAHRWAVRSLEGVPDAGALQGIVRYELGVDELRRGRPRAALAAFTEGRARFVAVSGEGDVELAYFEHGAGRALSALGRPAEAVVVLERALARRVTVGLDPRKIAEVELDLADALRATRAASPGKAPTDGVARASALEDGARARYAALGEAAPAVRGLR